MAFDCTIPSLRERLRTWPKQTLLTEDGKVGDCWRCCVSAVTGIPAEDVPHFVEISRNYLPDTQRWLNARGFYLLHCRGGEGFGMHRYHGDPVEAPPMISCGPTPRSRKMGAHHAVVTIGSDLVYDPHPWACGLTAVVEQFLILPFHPEQEASPRPETEGES